MREEGMWSREVDVFGTNNVKLLWNSIDAIKCVICTRGRKGGYEI